MAHLKKLPTYFVKGDDRVAAYYTIQARELIDKGYVQEGETEPAEIEAFEPEPIPEIAVEVGGNAFELEGKLEVEEYDLDSMTKVELMEYAEEHELKYKLTMPKAEILKICKESES